MSLLVTGSIGIDTVTTPYGVSKNCLGGSAIYFSFAASFFTPVRFAGVIGSDCPFDLEKFFEGRNVDLTGLETRDQSKTFRWKGSYHGSMNEAITDDVQLNVLAEAPPAVPEIYKDSEFVFLANTAPELQMQLLDQIDSPTFVAADTMNCWIENKQDDLKKLLARIDCLILNEDEARRLARQTNLITVAKEILKMGPSCVIIKKGQYGSLVVNKNDDIFQLPAYPAELVKDPTGAGDGFAGGLMGYLAKNNACDFGTLKTAIAYGTVVASFAISDFSLNGLMEIKLQDIQERFEKLKQLTIF